MTVVTEIKFPGEDWVVLDEPMVFFGPRLKARSPRGGYATERGAKEK